MKVDSKIKRSYEITIELDWDELDKILCSLDTAITDGYPEFANLYNGLTQAVSEKTPLSNNYYGGVVPR